MNQRIIRTYLELIRLETFEERFEYLRLPGIIGRDTFGFDRYLNQMFYESKEWKKLRRDIIVRDKGLDLGIKGYDINGPIYVHHINPLMKEDILNNTEYLLNPNFLICTSFGTHQAIHYGNLDKLPRQLIVRTKNDTCPWKK